MTLVRVAIAESCPMFGQMLTEVLDQQEDLSITDATSDLPLLTSLPHDVALVSSVLEGDPKKGFKLVQSLKTKVVMLLNCSPALVVEAFRIGARGVFCRSDSVALLPVCVRTVHSGKIWANAEQVELVFRAFSGARFLPLVSADGKGLLSTRERQVAQFVVDGLSNREIAERLELTEHTVKNYMFHIFNKLGISNRVELVLYAQNKAMK